MAFLGWQAMLHGTRRLVSSIRVSARSSKLRAQGQGHMGAEVGAEAHGCRRCGARGGTGVQAAD